MIYGAYGRVGIYRVQRLLHLLCGDAPDDLTRERLVTLSPAERWEAAEIMTGAVSRHSFFAFKATNPVTQLSMGPTLIPQFLATTGLASTRDIKRSGLMKNNACIAKLSIKMRLSPWSLRSLASVDGKRTLTEIHQHAAKEVEWPAFLSGFTVLYGYYNGVSGLVLSQPAVAGLS